MHCLSFWFVVPGCGGRSGQPARLELEKLKVQTTLSEHHMKLWSHRCFESYWKLGFYIANLRTRRWVQRTLHWKPAGALVAEHPRHDWSSKFPLYTGYRHMDDSHTLASKKKLWTHSIEDFVAFASGQDSMKNGPFYQKWSPILSKVLRPNWAAHGHAGWTLLNLEPYALLNKNGRKKKTEQKLRSFNEVSARNLCTRSPGKIFVQNFEKDSVRSVSKISISL